MAGIYIHIPFCRKACNYCNFHFSVSKRNMEFYTAAVLKEIELRKNYITDKEKINTIYFGGGTPSILNIESIANILEKIHQNYNVSSYPEITIECNPEDLNKEKLEKLKKIRINRLSIGIQSFSDVDLEYLGRNHSAAKAIESINLAKESGFENLTIDLIYGIPTLNSKQWKENIKTAFNLGIQHISAYCLTVEDKTILKHLISSKKRKEINDNEAVKNFKILMKLMSSNNYIHYEISNFAKGGFESKHNSSYWKGEKYLGLGASAHSYNLESRQWNTSNTSTYLDSINNNKPSFEIEILTKSQKFNEYILTSLRTIWGIDLNYVMKLYGEEYYNKTLNTVVLLIKNGTIIQEESRIYLSEKGKFFADAIAADLFL
jgi:oxygen-independent coproporphyrinogen-3 oxidase